MQRFNPSNPNGQSVANLICRLLCTVATRILTPRNASATAWTLGKCHPARRILSDKSMSDCSQPGEMKCQRNSMPSELRGKIHGESGVYKFISLPAATRHDKRRHAFHVYLLRQRYREERNAVSSRDNLSLRMDLKGILWLFTVLGYCGF